jgi:hypothetical protein
MRSSSMNFLLGVLVGYLLSNLLNLNFIFQSFIK